MNYRPPPWDAPLDLEEDLGRIPPETTISGAMIGQTAAAARAAGVADPVMRDRYQAHERYPLHEHAKLLVRMSRTVYAARTARHAMRSMGRAAVQVYMESLVGRVTVGSTDDAEVMLHHLMRSYELNISTAKARLLSFRPGQAELLLERVPYFLDSHHVGIVEGCLKRCNVNPEIEIRPVATDAIAFRCRY